jgi:hypothetical protein
MDDGGNSSCGSESGEPCEECEESGYAKGQASEGNDDKQKAEDKSYGEESGSSGPRVLGDAAGGPLGDGIDSGEGTGGGVGQSINLDGGGTCREEGDAEDPAKKQKAGADVFRTKKAQE